MSAPVAPFIPVAAGIVAVFDEYGIDTLPVVAYDADGDALVPSTDGRLEVAGRRPGFQRITCADSHHTVPRQLIPGGGWALTHHPYANTPDQSVTEPVIAWALCVDGAVRPVIDGGDHLEVHEFDDTPFALSHPDTTQAVPDVQRNGTTETYSGTTDLAGT